MLTKSGPKLRSPPTCGSAKLTVTVYDSFEGTSISRSQWDQFILDVGGDLYVTFDWCRVWWRHYGGNRQLQVYVFREGTRLVGLAPIFIEHVRLGLVSLKIAKRVGADFSLTLFALPLEADCVEAIYRELVGRLIDEENCDAIWLGFMPGNDPTLNGLRNVCRSIQNRVTVVRDAPCGVHTQFHLPDTFNSYIAGLDQQRRSQYRRRRKRLDTAFKIERDVVKDLPQARVAFASFKSLHALQWKAQGKLGHFGDWPQSDMFNEDLINEMSCCGRLRIIRLFADRQLVACQYAFVFGDCCYWRLPARVADAKWHHFGLGVLGLQLMFETLIGEGVRRVEAGMGHYDYKLQLGGEELEFRTAVIASTRSGVALRVHLFLLLSDFYQLAYYKFWRLRLAPRLPFHIGPLSRSWIRSNFGSFTLAHWLKTPKDGSRGFWHLRLIRRPPKPKQAF